MVTQDPLEPTFVQVADSGDEPHWADRTDREPPTAGRAPPSDCRPRSRRRRDSCAAGSSSVIRSPLSRVLLVASACVAAFGIAACGPSEPDEHAEHAGHQPAAAAAPEAPGGHGGGQGGAHGSGAVVPAPTLYAVQTGPLGIVLTDGSGRLVYRSDAHRADPPTSTCVDECAQNWIPIP